MSPNEIYGDEVCGDEDAADEHRYDWTCDTCGETYPDEVEAGERDIYSARCRECVARMDRYDARDAAEELAEQRWELQHSGDY